MDRVSGGRKPTPAASRPPGPPPDPGPGSAPGPAPEAAPGRPPARAVLRQRPVSRVRRHWFRYATGAIAASVFVLALLIAWELWQGSLPAWETFGLGFLTSSEWDPVRRQFGALPFIAGTLLTSFMALALALPVAFGIAILLSEYMAPAFRDPLIFVVELLAAIPSVVLGLWGIFVLAPVMQRHVIPAVSASPLGYLPFFGEPGPGYTLLTASVILAIMVIPIIASLSREVLLAVPRELKEGALALGATRWETTRHVVLSYGREGLFSAVVLGFGRALGETMATTMTIGNRVSLTLDFHQPGYSMTAIIANEFREAATDIHISALVAIGLVLFVLSFVLNAVGRLLVLRPYGRNRRGT